MAGNKGGRPRKDATAAVSIHSTGIGESKRFGGSNEKDLSHMNGTTVNGEALPESCYETFPYSLTDQGKAEMERERKNLPVSYNRAEKPFDFGEVPDDDKKLAKYKNDLRNAPPARNQRSAMSQLMEQHCPAGHRGLWMGRLKTEQAGMFRDEIEYRPVLRKNPETGTFERIQIGGMFLASVPEDVARQQERLNYETAREKQVGVEEKVREKSDQIMSSRNLKDLAKKRSQLDDLMGSADDDPESADAELMLAHEHESAEATV